MLARGEPLRQAQDKLVEPRIDANPFSYFVVLVATGMDDSEGAERPKNLR